ncbi:NAD(P)-binding protein [Leucogyrophana mollusca]|uniref:NAD(P)-binding protein n=1 Tax=Leucogyrophana mollusca TaxID=85980 RepID=A0ACB8BJ70_9AGAM|nr:NAD(P)-binding protein [Leucogyrophana mollusca]
MVKKLTWLITGASRGIGLGLVKALLASPENIVFAPCRDPASARELQALSGAHPGSLRVVQLDVTEEASIHSAKALIEGLLDGSGLDFLINNAAITAKDDRPSNFTIADLTSAMISNAGGPAIVTRIFIPLIEQSSRKVIVNISSSLSSIGTDFGGQEATYSMSKAALNMLTYKQHKERPDLIPFLLDPGWVKTDMGGAGASVETEDSVSGMLRVIIGATHEYAGRFYSYTGKTMSW